MQFIVSYHTELPVGTVEVNGFCDSDDTSISLTDTLLAEPADADAATTEVSSHQSAMGAVAPSLGAGTLIGRPTRHPTPPTVWC